MNAFKPSPDRKMIKLLTCGKLFPATTLGTLSKDNYDVREQQRRKTIGFMSKTTALPVHHAL